MKKIFFLMSFLLSGCSSIVSLYPIYNDDVSHGERFWINKNTGEQASFDLYTKCYHKGIKMDLTQRNLPLNSLDYDQYNATLNHGKCLYDLGYVFKEDIFSKYCYHYSNEVECKVFRKYNN